LVLKFGETNLNRCLGNIHTKIIRDCQVAGLISITTSIVEHPRNAVLLNEPVDKASLELCQKIIRAGARISSVAIAPFPVATTGKEETFCDLSEDFFSCV